MTLEQLQSVIPQSMQTAFSWSAVGTSVAAFCGAIQGPLSVIATVCSIVWLGMQMYVFIKKHWRRR